MRLTTVAKYLGMTSTINKKRPLGPKTRWMDVVTQYIENMTFDVTWDREKRREFVMTVILMVQTSEEEEDYIDSVIHIYL